MKTYWDTSAVINAAISPVVKAALDSGEHTTRPHTFAEFFNCMTDRGVRWQDSAGTEHRLLFDAGDAARWLRDFRGRVELVELDGEETLSALEGAKAKGVSGPRVHDLLHAAAAEKAGADRLLTRNLNDFTGLSARVPAVFP